MIPAPLIPLAAGEGPGLDVVVWLVVGAFWLVSQMVAAKRQKERRRQREEAQGAESQARSGAGTAPAPEELAEIFRRLGAEVPGTPPPPPQLPLQAPPTPQRRHASSKRTLPRVSPDLARRLADAKRDAAEAARRAAEEDRAARAALDALPRVQGGPHDNVGADALRAGTILPRLYAMDLRMVPLPSVPLPGFDRRRGRGSPPRPPVKTRQGLRQALVAHAILQPSANR